MRLNLSVVIDKKLNKRLFCYATNNSSILLVYAAETQQHNQQPGSNRPTAQPKQGW
jgi:hypothetical protein